VSTRRTVSLRFRSRARLIAATVALQAIMVGVVSFAAIRGIQYYYEQELDSKIAEDAGAILTQYEQYLGPKLGVVDQSTTPEGWSGEWFEGIKQQIKQTDVTFSLGTTVVAFQVSQDEVVQVDATVGHNRDVQPSLIATTPESSISAEKWREILKRALPTTKAMPRSPVSTIVTTDKKREMVSVVGVPVWEQSSSIQSASGASTRSGWVVLMAHRDMDMASQSSRFMVAKLVWWFVCVGVLLIGVSILGTMIFARRYDTKIHQMNDELERAAQDSSRRALQIRNGMIFGLAKLADYRDTDTGQHLERISQYCAMLALELMDDFPEINQAWIEKLRVASSMHDIGKVGIPDYILLKPGALTASERKIMENHPIIGADTLIAIRRRSGDDELLNIAIQVTLSHHERFDGKGYPFGLSRDQIPLAARIVSLADMYDALTSKAKRIIREGMGTQFDPKIVNAFIRIQRQFDETRREMAHDEVAIPHAKTPPVNDVPGPDAQPSQLPATPELAKPDRRAA
jgi:hypothetical protein